MSRIITVVSICISVLLFYPTGLAIASPRVQQDGYTLSEVALAAAKRFSSEPVQRKYADLELVLKDLCKPGDTRIGLKADCQPISRQQFIDLLGSPDQANANFTMWGITYELQYFHTYGSTYFSFEGDRLNNYLFFGEPVYFYALPQQPFVKRAWHKVSRWPRKLVGALF